MESSRVDLCEFAMNSVLLIAIISSALAALRLNEESLSVASSTLGDGSVRLYTDADNSPCVCTFCNLFSTRNHLLVFLTIREYDSPADLEEGRRF